MMVVGARPAKAMRPARARKPVMRPSPLFKLLQTSSPLDLDVAIVSLKRTGHLAPFCRRSVAMCSILKGVCFGTLMVAGAVAGAAAAFYATFYACVLIDSIRGAGGGNGIVTVGWLFCFLTVPAGLYCGGYLGGVLAAFLVERLGDRKRKLQKNGPSEAWA